MAWRPLVFRLAAGPIALFALGLFGGCTAGVDPTNGLTFGSGQSGTASATAQSGEGTDTADTERDEVTADGTASSGENLLDTTGGFESTTGTSGANDETQGGETQAGACAVGETRSCYSGPANTDNQGECGAGTQTCDGAGGWGPCTGETLPGVESCNGLDDDCNGVADDGNPGGGGSCSSGLQGPCQAGTLVCSTSGTLDCEPDVTPSASDTCGNGVDDDCNGIADDGCVCDPLNPAAACGAGNHCIPATNGIPQCIGPVGAGGQYTPCVSSSECAAPFECISTGQGTTYCMQWCTSDFDCPILSDFCTGLSPAVGVGATEWGVCYDGFP